MRFVTACFGNMEDRTMLLYFLFILLGFLSGSVLYSYLLPKWLKGVDIVAQSNDKNPGTANAMKYAGTPVGFLCLLFDMLKGFLPVWLALRRVSPFCFLFSAVMAAPVLGHAFSPMMRWKGGKGIAVSFGILLAFLPDNILVFLLAGIYIVFSVVLVIHPNERRTVCVFFLFAILQLLFPHPLPIKAGVILIANVVILKNWRDAFTSNGRKSSAQIRPDKYVS